MSGIARYSGLHRPTIYQVLPQLKKRGLIAEVPKKKQKLYVAEPPEKLRGLISELLGELEKVIPELNSIFNRSKGKTLVKFLGASKV